MFQLKLKNKKQTKQNKRIKVVGFSSCKRCLKPCSTTSSFHTQESEVSVADVEGPRAKTHISWLL